MKLLLMWLQADVIIFFPELPIFQIILVYFPNNKKIINHKENKYLFCSESETLDILQRYYNYVDFEQYLDVVLSFSFLTLNMFYLLILVFTTIIKSFHHSGNSVMQCKSLWFPLRLYFNSNQNVISAKSQILRASNLL